MKQRFILNFPMNHTEEPLTYVLIKTYDIKVNILKAAISAGGGELLIEAEADEKNMQAGLEYLRKNNVGIEAVDKKIHFKKDGCIDCGACTAVCFPNALTMDKNTWELQFNSEKCVVCGYCIKACPLRLFETTFGK